MDENFKKSLKPPVVEEMVDYYFYRRLAYFLVPVFIKLGISPNMVTTMSLIWGVAAAWLALHQSFFTAGIFAIVAIVFDCCDGQVARLTGKSSPVGRAMDGFYDLVWVALMWFAIFYSHALEQTYEQKSLLILMYAAGASVIAHCWTFDGIKVKYLTAVEGTFQEGAMSAGKAIELMKSEFRKHHYSSCIFAFFIFIQAYFFVDGSIQRNHLMIAPDQIPAARKQLDPIIRAWTYLGEGHHNTLIVIGLLFMPLTHIVLYAAFCFILIPMNLWWIYCYLRWNSVYSKAFHLGSATSE
jgi:phosphatidylserine synthase